jgi:hypothetical protein
MNDLSELLPTLISCETDLDGATRLVADYLVDKEPDRVVELLVPPLRAYISRWQRCLVRERENVVFGQPSTARPADPLAGRRAAIRDMQKLKHLPFSVGGKKVLWGTATIAQHLLRAEEQRAQAGSIAEDAHRHERVADLLQREGVECLNDLPDEKLVKEDL